MHFFRQVVAMQCEQPGCQFRRHRSGSHERFCSGCGERLTPVRKWAFARIILAIGGAAVSVLIGYGVVSVRAHLPRPLKAEHRSRLEARVRTAYEDGMITPQERADLGDALIAQERIAREAVEGVIDEVRQRLEKSRQRVAKGNRLAAELRWRPALEEFRQAVSDDPSNGEGWARLGMAQVSLGLDNEALESSRVALQLQPGNRLALYHQGLLQSRQGRPNLASQSWGAMFRGMVDAPPLPELTLALASPFAPHGARPRLPPGSPLSFRATSARKGYLMLFSLSPDGTIVCLYPNRQRLSLEIAGGVALTLPLDEDRRKGFELMTTAPLGPERIFLLRLQQPAPSLPIGRDVAGWLLEYPPVAAPGANPAYSFVEWIARLRQDGRRQARLTELEIEIVGDR